MDEIWKHTNQPKIRSCIIITDFSKAFNWVDHNIAIPKLLNMGARPALSSRIYDFLADRIQCVRYRDVLSDWGKTLQRCSARDFGWSNHLLSLANDAAVMEDSNKMAFKYADDLTMVENISVSQQITIQCDLDSFDQWVTENHVN